MGRAASKETKQKPRTLQRITKLRFSYCSGLSGHVRVRDRVKVRVAMDTWVHFFSYVNTFFLVNTHRAMGTCIRVIFSHFCLLLFFVLTYADTHTHTWLPKLSLRLWDCSVAICNLIRFQSLFVHFHNCRVISPRRDLVCGVVHRVCMSGHASCRLSRNVTATTPKQQNL